MVMNINTVKGYMRHGLNILVTGPAGTGKTAILKEAAKVLDLKMKYYSAATIDPYTDLVGIPVPNTETKQVEYYRPKEIDEAEVIFLDEANRADPKTLNTLFELIQFRSINGEKLPNLKCVVAAINPNNDDYQVDDLDVALVDRFDIYLSQEPKIDYGYFSKTFTPEIAKTVKSFWEDYHLAYTRNQNNSSKQNSMVYISPRRMEKIVSAFMKFPQVSTITDTLPVGAAVNVNRLFRLLKESETGKIKVKTISQEAKVRHYLNMSTKNKRKSNFLVKELLENENISASDKTLLLNDVAVAISSSVGVSRIVSDWSEVIEEFSDATFKVMTSSWTFQKHNSFYREIPRNSKWARYRYA